MAEFIYQDPFPLAKDTTQYRLLTDQFVSLSNFEGEEVLKIEPDALTRLARKAMRDASFLLRSAHLEQVAAILHDPDASDNDKNVALAMLRNAEVAAKGVLPLCQDTGTATVVAKKGQGVWTGARDEEFLSRGIFETYAEENLRYSQTSPLTMYEEKNSGNNLPAQIDVYATEGMEYRFLFVAKGGGSANKSFLYQQTKATLHPDKLEAFLVEKMKTLGTAACPPYHLAFVIGGTSAEACMKTVKLASTHYLDALPTDGNRKYFALDVRVIRLPRHGASCPIGMGVSCSAHRNVKAKINRDGIWIEELENDPGRFIPDKYRKQDETGVVAIDLNRPMNEITAELSKYPVKTQLSLTGTIIVARDIAHAKMKERLDRGEGIPQYFKDYPVYYAGPAKTPAGLPSGSFGPTTAGRMDSYVAPFQAEGASMVMIAKGNRSKQVTDACEKYGGFYLGSIGGPAAILAQENIKKVELLEYPELGMEAIYKIDVVEFPAFILVDDKGNDFFESLA
jgi:fumarate hydratase class I